MKSLQIRLGDYHTERQLISGYVDITDDATDSELRTLRSYLEQMVNYASGRVRLSLEVVDRPAPPVPPEVSIEQLTQQLDKLVAADADKIIEFLSKKFGFKVHAAKPVKPTKKAAAKKAVKKRAK